MFEAMGDLQYFQTQGDSMWPLLRSGDRVLVRFVSPVWLERSDLVVYRNAENVICHRLVECRKDDNGFVLYCRADTALRLGLERVFEEKYLGKVVAFARGGKLYSLESGIFRWHAVNRVVAPLCVVLVRIKLLLRMGGICS